MSSNVEEDDYSNNIDDQLLSVAKQEGVVVDPTSGIEHLAATNKVNKDSQHQQVQQVQQQTQQQLQQQQQLEQQAAATARQIAGAQDPYKRQYQQLQQQQQHQQHQHQHQHQHHQQHQQQLQQQAELHGHYNQADDLESEYNIQIPDPIVDTKSKIYPVTENTITADGNLITRPYPEQAFHSRDDLNEFIQEFARDNGFGVVISHSNKKAIYYTCELGGRYRHKKSKKDTIEDTSRHVDVGGGYLLDPNTKTKKLRCPFAMTASYKKSTGVWTLKTTCNEHNHPQLDPLSNHPMLRKRSDELNLLILDLYKVGTKPSHIESKIKEQYPDVIIKREDIYNEIRGYKRKLKKQNARFGFGSRVGHNKTKMEVLQAAGLTGNHTSSGPNTGPNDDSAAAAAAVAAATNAILSAGNVDDNQGSSDPQVLQYQHSQQQQEEFQRQFVAAAVAQQQHQHHQHHHHQQHQIDEAQFQQYQHLQDHDDSTAAAAIAAVTNATRHGHYHHNEADLSMENIDSRLVGE